MEVVHEGLVLELTAEAAGIAQTIPGLDTYKGSVLPEGAPEGDDGGAEFDRDLGIACFVEQFGTAHLTLVDLHAVVAPGVVGELDDAALGFDGHLGHLVGAVDIALQTVEGLGVVETDAAVLALAGLHVGDVEGGVAADLEVDLALVGVEHVPDDADGVAVEDVADAEGEVVGIDLTCLLARFEGEGDLAVALGDQFEVGVAGKAVAGKVVLLAVDTVGVVVDAADDGKEDGGVARPVFGIGLPQVLLTVGVFDTLELGSLFGYDDGDLFVLQFYHSDVVFWVSACKDSKKVKK